MNKFTVNIKAKYQKFSKSEKKIADFLLLTPQNEVPLYITELANACNTSEATVVRFAKRLGFDGYQQLKIAIAQEHVSHPVNEKITQNDSAYDIFGKVCEDIYCSLEKTKSSLSAQSLQKSCNALLSANKIIIVGLGNSASVALDAAHKLLRLGMNVTAYTDNHMQAIAVSHTDDKSVVMGISHSGRSKDIVQALQIAKENGATTVSLTNFSNSPLNKVSDYTLYTVSDETNYRILGLSSRIAQLAIIDTIYSYLVCHLKNATECIKVVENALTVKKI